MQRILFIPALIIAPFAAIYLLGSITGDPLSAVMLALIAFISIVAWFSGAPASGGRHVGRR